ncbi:MAG TPA: peptidylprolyl isomerase [Methanomicrobia archaeon]|nr:peptidylprolyl isomerase [Methanomicrobia archaeon]
MMNKGDFVVIDYLAKVKATGEYFDTTDEEKAKELGLLQEDKTFKPVTVVVGANHVIEGLDEALEEMDVGEERTVEVPPEKAFGRRDPNLVTTIPMREFSKQGIMPRRGMSLEVGGKWAIVKSVSSGRVTLDYNHSLASRDLVYDVKVLSKVEDTTEKLKSLIELHLGTFDESNNSISIDEGGKATVTMPSLKKGLADIVKSILEKEVGTHVPEIKEIEVTTGSEE